jgi:hypothetical protein
MSEQNLIVTARHLKGAGGCLGPAARDFFARHSLDFRDFVRNGINAERLLATGDAMAADVVEFARRDVMQNG